MAVIPSFSGDGMAIALRTAVRAVECYLAGDDGDAYHRRMRRELLPPVRRALWLSTLGGTRLGRQCAVWACRGVPSLLPRIATATRLRTEVVGLTP